MPNLTDIKIPITDSQALTPVETQVSGVGATPVLPSMEIEKSSWCKTIFNSTF